MTTDPQPLRPGDRVEWVHEVSGRTVRGTLATLRDDGIAEVRIDGLGGRVMPVRAKRLAREGSGTGGRRQAPPAEPGGTVEAGQADMFGGEG